MGTINLDAYISFAGNAREGMEFYKGIFGGEVDYSTFGDVPGTSEDMKDKIMHALLEGGDIRLMGSDAMESAAQAGKISLSLSGDDDEKLRRFFDGLAAGGEVTSPLKTESWGDTFGQLKDQFGVHWMVNINAKKE